MEESIAQNIYSIKRLIRCDLMKKKTLLLLLILTVSIYTLNINVQITAEENNYRPTSLELTPHELIEITSDSNFTDYGFLGIGTAEDPYIIEGYNITTTNDFGIYIGGTTKYFIVRNCCIDVIYIGIYIDDVADGTPTVINNTCINNLYGIALEDSVSSTVTNNTCSNSDFGIYLGASVNSTVTNNTCSNNNNGIYLLNSDNSTVTNNNCNSNDIFDITLEVSGNSTVVNNTCNNSDIGIWLRVSGNSTVVNNTCSNNIYAGILFYISGGSTVANNTCSYNNNHGIWLFESAFCIITYNLLQENEGYGVNSSYGSDNNLIHHNNFIDNNLGGTSQAYDGGTDNIWYEKQEGNYWSDWSGTGSYSIDGLANSVDLYPLEEPVVVEYPQIVLLTLLLSIIPLILTRIISKNVKKKNSC